MGGCDGDERAIFVKAKPVFGTLVFYCREFGEFGEKGVSCGKECESYAPCNGKNGKCKHMGFTYEATDEKFILKNVNNRLGI
jgi:hypothetical protein